MLYHGCASIRARTGHGQIKPLAPEEWERAQREGLIELPGDWRAAFAEAEAQGERIDLHARALNGRYSGPRVSIPRAWWQPSLIVRP